jgi:hypothetical protein
MCKRAVDMTEGLKGARQANQEALAVSASLHRIHRWPDAKTCQVKGYMRTQNS